MLVDGVLEVNQDKGAIRRSLADPLDRGEGGDRENGVEQHLRETKSINHKEINYKANTIAQNR